MHSHVFRCHQYFSNPLISILLLSLIIPIHNAQNYSEMYKVCSKMTTSACGKPIRGIEYPFWGQNIRPEYCGLKGFELSCEENDLVVDIGTDSKYQVAEINPSRSLLTLNPYGDAVKKVCASSWDSSKILNETLYEYGKNTEGFRLYYNCDSGSQDTERWILSNITCSGDDDKFQLFYSTDNSVELPPQGIRCSNNITLPVDKTMHDQFLLNNSMPLGQILEYRFEVHYKINNSACSDCKESGGVCWKNTDLEVDSKCLYETGGKNEHQAKEVAPSGKNKNSGLKFIIASCVVGGSVLLLFVLIIYYRQMKSKHVSSLFSQNVSSYPKDIEAFIRENGSSIPKRFRVAIVNSNLLGLFTCYSCMRA
ncbi:hypothetical protein POM88_047465 [Heracleum sosnowskyi]|uniref:non-specific serine/threonine protein kinase n=1 Tax=Heracleum sosnowskyi TaxID=360622 RepID=A0AAD8GTY4_9APIA|nr:hypothetical protein POM88_047465 [Heracleum sosnowskyi]